VLKIGAYVVIKKGVLSETIFNHWNDYIATYSMPIAQYPIMDISNHLFYTNDLLAQAIA
jgi:hypothetical protein